LSRSEAGIEIKGLTKAYADVTVVAWIAAEIELFATLGFTPLYPLIGGIGGATVLLSLLLPVRRYYSRS